MTAPHSLLVNIFQSEISDTRDSGLMWAEINTYIFDELFNETSFNIKIKK